jgi:hypothetical protein
LAAQLGELEIMEFLADVGADARGFVDHGCLSTFKFPRKSANSKEWKDWQRNLRVFSRSAQIPLGNLNEANPVQELARCYLDGNPAAFCTEGTTILHVCVMHDQPAVLERLVIHCNAQMHLRTAWQQTPLLAAAAQVKALTPPLRSLSPPPRHALLPVSDQLMYICLFYLGHPSFAGQFRDVRDGIRLCRAHTLGVRRGTAPTVSCLYTDRPARAC